VGFLRPASACEVAESHSTLGRRTLQPRTVREDAYQQTTHFKGHITAIKEIGQGVGKPANDFSSGALFPVCSAMVPPEHFL
jgi:hypothetical protein